MSKAWSPKDIPPQTGKRAIVTGANSGIGWNTALELARAGAEVVVPARTQAKSDDAARRIRAEVPQANVRTGVLDLSSLASVRAFAAAELKDPRPIDLLINNAGIMAVATRELSVDGYEMQFATNVLGPYVLTGLLLPALLRAPAPRVVTVSSMAHKMSGGVPLQDLNSERGYNPWSVYGKTKLANILFTNELQRRAGNRLMAVSCHPGVSRTNLTAKNSVGVRFGMWLVSPLTQDAARGAEPTLFAATSPDAKPTAYYGPDGLFDMAGNVKEAKTAAFARDTIAAQRLFGDLEQMTGTRYAL